MPCEDAMITDVVTARPDQTVSEALTLFKDHNIRSVPVVDENNVIVGLFSFSHLLYGILPVPVTMGEQVLRIKYMDISLDHLTGASPWVAKRLKIMLPKKIEEVMLKNPVSVHPDTPLREGIRLMVKYDSPLPVVDEESRKLLGLISSQTALAVLLEIADHIEQGKDVHE
jgi:CBS domain-containing protein